VQDERTHGDDASGRHETVNGRNLSDETLDVGLRQDTQGMGSGKDTQWPVIFPRVVEVQAQGYHARQCRRRRMRVIDPRLHRPRTPARHVAAFLQWQLVS